MTAAERAEQRAKASEGRPEWLRGMNSNGQRQLLYRGIRGDWMPSAAAPTDGL
jgi:hypothetical protein